ncbi:MAG TPA: TonB-dependent receptor [Sphingobacteriaceae bacterium]
MKNFFYLKCMLPVFLVLLSTIAFGQSASVTGKVVDEKNLPLPGASVSIMGTSLSTSTDMDGNYRLSAVPTGRQTLVVRFIGYTDVSRVINVNGTTTINVTITPSSQSLNEVVVVGYGTQRKKDLTGSVVSVTEKDFVKGQLSTPEQLIAGKVAGVQITSNGGAPGSGSTIRIRGGASLNASNDPLIVVDGVPLDNNPISGSPNGLALINPNDIETFSILKDASAAAIYGSRASNGVILITTKKGSSGKPSLNFSSNASYATVANKADVMSAAEFSEFVKNSTSPLATPALKALLGTANTDWQDAIYQNALTTDNNLSLSGSVKNMPYRVSLGYLNQDGALTSDNLQRTALSLNLSPKFFNNSLKLDLNLKGSTSNTQFADRGAIGAAASFDPSKPITSGANSFGGYWEWLDASSTNGLRGLAPKNPMGLLNQRTDRGTVLRSIGNLQLDYTFPFLTDLRANLNVGYDISKGEGTIVVPGEAASNNKRFIDANSVAQSGINNEYLQEKTNLLTDFYLNYVKDLKSINSRIDVMAGTSYQDFLTNAYSFADYSISGVKRPGSDPNFPLDKPQNRLISFYGRMIYSLNDRYVLTTSLRTDGSSRLAPDNRWGVFPSAAFAWNVAEESFLKSSKVVSELKLRVGYGITGQQEGISNYSYLGNYTLSNGTAQYQLGNNFYNMYRPSAYNPNLKWEQTATTNVGLDFGFANNRVTGSVDYYIKNTKDLLNVITQPAGTNFINEFIANVGSMENRGAEFLLNTRVIDKKDLDWNVGFNTTYNNNEITKLTTVNDPNYPGVLVNGISGGTGNTIQIHSTGFNRASFYVYQQVYDANGKPLEDVYVDRNKDGIISDKDLYRFKNPDADVYLGLNSNMTYKNWNAGFVMRASIGNYVYNNVASSTGTLRNIFNPLNYLNNGSRDVLYTNFTGSGSRYMLSDYYVQNASFLRMDNINLGYNFGRVLGNKANLRVNANAQNVFVITKYNGVDPEINGGVDNNFYLRPRTFVLGFNLDF